MQIVTHCSFKKLTVSLLSIISLSMFTYSSWHCVSKKPIKPKQESSAKLTNQRVSYAFTSSPFSFHARHIYLLPSSSIVILVFTYLLQTSVNSMCENCECKTVNTVHWFDASCSVISVNNSITLISQVQSLAGLHFLPLTVYAKICKFPNSFLRKPERRPIGCRARTRF